MRPRRPGGAPPAAFRIELSGIGAAGRSTEVRVTLIDASTGKRLAAKVVPFDWFADIAYRGTCTIEIDEGVWS